MKKRQKTKSGFGGPEIALLVITILHLVGAGLLMFSKGLLYQISLDLVPLNLILTTLIAVKFQTEYSRQFFIFFGLAFLTGFLAEIIGVNSGIPFGYYSYGKTLGIQIFNTPLVIGLNWFLIAYGVGSFLSPLKFPAWAKWLTSTGLLVFFDYFMEPVALKHDFWSWTNGNIPVSNYIGWAIVSAVIMLFFYSQKMEKKNPVAGRIWLVQFCFFIIQNLI